MKFSLEFFIGFALVVIVVGVGIYLISNNANKINARVQKQTAGDKERIICSSTVDRKCYRYRCESGFPELTAPGGPGLCLDGSTPIKMEEIPFDQAPTSR